MPSAIICLKILGKKWQSKRKDVTMFPLTVFSQMSRSSHQQQQKDWNIIMMECREPVRLFANMEADGEMYFSILGYQWCSGRFFLRMLIDCFQPRNSWAFLTTMTMMKLAGDIDLVCYVSVSTIWSAGFSSFINRSIGKIKRQKITKYIF